MTEPFLELQGIAKLYPGVVALDDVSLAVEPGEVIGLVGENGAGKSTLMKVLGGVVAPDRGRIRDRRGRAQRDDGARARSPPASPSSTRSSTSSTTSTPPATSSSAASRAPGPLRLLDRRRMAAEVRPIFARLGVDFGPDAPVAELSLAQRQLLEIAKALSLEEPARHHGRADLEPDDLPRPSGCSR